MEHRIEISLLPQWQDARGAGVARQIRDTFGLPVNGIRTRDVYLLAADLAAAEAAAIAAELAHPVLQRGIVGETRGVACDWLIRVGFRPGVTDNVGRTAHEAVGDIVGRRLRDDEQVFSSIEYLLDAPDLSRVDVERIARGLLANELIETVLVLSREELAAAPIPPNRPVVREVGGGEVREIDLEVDDARLLAISRDGTLALTLDEMKVIQAYFRSAQDRGSVGLGPQPTDVELECIAQTWSEHCKHKIFAAEIDYEDDAGRRQRIVSLFKTFIQRGTGEIGKKVDWLVSVFHDNAGVIAFNDQLDLVYKVETHNSPSALDPYGGAMTGIVGVNRDPMGTGQGADLLINVWGYCLGSPFTPAADVPDGLLHPRRLRDGIHKGVIDGGNQSGIPYGLGWEYFEERYLGKPLVYCGTVGTLPKRVGKVRGHEKSIRPGDKLVMTGGRIGKDGIHGATFSSEELHQDSPVQAVQIGDPITQKKMGDFIHEARDRGLYRFVTDNGAGGLSSSLGEMSEHSGGCRLDLSLAPLKYAGLQPWEILLSEAQERMSFAVPPEDIDAFLALSERRDVEATVLGEFTDSGKFHALYAGRTVAWIDLEFLHHGLPPLQLRAKWTPPRWPEPDLAGRDPGADLVTMLGRLNLCSNETKARQYDHEVKGLSVIKPFVGVNRDVVGDATVTMPAPLATEGIVLAAGIAPRYSDIDTYAMMASVIDVAVRRVIAVGGQLGHIAGLDNFCWPDPVRSDKTPDGEYKLAQLVRANQALYDICLAYSVPCISGKDSMKNDSTRGGRKISIPPTVLFSVIARMADIRCAVTLDAKAPGDLVYVLGDTAAELGGSEYFYLLGHVGNAVPALDPAAALKLYGAVGRITAAKLARSLHTPALGGLGVALAKVAIGGRLGLDIDLDRVPLRKGKSLSVNELLWSESNSRFVMTVAPAHAAKVEKILAGTPFARVGTVAADPTLVLRSSQLPVPVALPVAHLADAYRRPLAGV
jgi:phosphoribosylformylglycinamidine synthase